MKNKSVAIALLLIFLLSMISLMSEEIIESKELIEILNKSSLPENSLKKAFSELKFMCNVWDSMGYLWYMTLTKNYYEVYRYDNYSFELMLQLEKKSNEKQMETSLFKLKENKIVVVLDNYFYVWDEVKFKKFDLMADENIIFKTEIDDKLLVVGKKGYYIYQDDSLISYSYHKSKVDYQISKQGFTYWRPFINQEKVGNLFNLDKNNNLVSLHFNYYPTTGRFKYNSSDDFRYIEQLSPKVNDLYLHVYNDNFIDSLFIMNAENYNELINPGTVPEIIRDSNSNLYLYFKYTNYIYSVSTDERKIMKEKISSNYKIIQYFNDETDEDWLIYQDRENIYLSKLSDFLSNNYSLAYSYKLPTREADSGGSYCLLWQDESIKFNTSGELNNKVFTDEDDIYSEDEDFEEQYKLNYVTFLKNDSNSTNHILTTTLEKNNVAALNLLNITDNMVISKTLISEEKILKVEFHDLMDNSKYYKYFRFPQLQYGWSLRNFTISYSRRNDQINIFTFDLLGSSYFTSTLKTLWSQLLSDKIFIKNYSTNYIKNNYIIIEDYSKKVVKIFQMNEDKKLTLTDTLVNPGFNIPNNSTKHLYFFQGNQNHLEINDYNIENKLMKTIITFSFSDKFCIGLDRILIANDLGYDLFAYTDDDLDKITTKQSNQLNTLIDSLKIKLYNSKIFDNYVFIPDYNILYNLIEDNYRIEENWEELIETGDSNYFLSVKRDTISQENEYSIKKFSEGELLDSNYDFELKTSDQYFHCLTSNNKLFPFVIGDTLFYFYNNKWCELSNKHIKEIIPEVYGSKFEIYDDSNFLWMEYWDKLVHYSYDYEISMIYDYKQGLPNTISNFKITNENEYYVLGKDYYDAEEVKLYKLNKSLLNPTLDISWLEVNGERKDLSKPLRFSSSENTIAFPVAILNYMYPEDYPMKYKLTGFDDDWKVGTYAGKITYENLQPGKYAFDIQAFPTDFSDMSWSTIEFRILPPWYRSWWAYTAYFLFISLVIYLIFKQRIKLYKKNQEVLENKVNERTHELSEKTTELTEKTLLLTEEQQKMRESIEYASLIQRSILPQESELNLLFQEHFVIWKPRDIVGGDFYWFYDNQDKQEAYLAVIDCTGHGVPGALLSMTVNSLLNYTVKDRKITSPAQIVNLLHQEIGSLMHQRAERSVQDGFEISLLKIDYAKQSMSFCGAGLNIILQAPDQELQIIKGDKYNVGGLKLYTNINFTEESFAYQADTKIYLYSDGIIDQPNPDSEIKRRLGYKGWIEILQSLDKLSMEEQARELNI
ncbi:SpoIIE family protein phosphatase, partial [bacterium]|nr:SpoIIE family protein phosphatase [bacterium]